MLIVDHIVNYHKKMKEGFIMNNDYESFKRYKKLYADEVLDESTKRSKTIVDHIIMIPGVECETDEEEYNDFTGTNDQKFTVSYGDDSFSFTVRRDVEEKKSIDEIIEEMDESGW